MIRSGSSSRSETLKAGAGKRLVLTGFRTLPEGRCAMLMAIFRGSAWEKSCCSSLLVWWCMR